MSERGWHLQEDLAVYKSIGTSMEFSCGFTSGVVETSFGSKMGVATRAHSALCRNILSPEVVANMAFQGSIEVATRGFQYIPS